VRKALVEKWVYRKTAPRGNYFVTAWHCPINPTKYSFGISYRGGVAAFNEFEENPYVSGCYDSPDKALQAGINNVYNDI